MPPNEIPTAGEKARVRELTGLDWDKLNEACMVIVRLGPSVELKNGKYDFYEEFLSRIMAGVVQ